MTVNSITVSIEQPTIVVTIPTWIVPHVHAISAITGLQTALDGKVDENSAITWATKTKITYDAKWLVTGGADATTADIADSLNKRYVTDAERTVIQNTSWTNTWDETASSIITKIGNWTYISNSYLSLTKSDVGLGNVDNTSDLNKPISTAVQAALDAKVTGNVAITWATKTKITYDSKGLVTSWTDATTADIADSTDRRYVTDAQRTIIQNTTASFTTAQETKLGYISITQAVDLDALETAVAALDQATILKWTWDASAGTFPGSWSAQAGRTYIVSVAGTVDGVSFAQNDRILAIVDNASTTTFASNWFKLDYTDQVLSVNWYTGTITLTKSDVWLGDVDNTSDLNKPISTATQTALNLKITWPGTVVDNALPRYDGTTGYLLQSSLVSVDDSWNLTTTWPNISIDSTWSAPQFRVYRSSTERLAVGVASWNNQFFTWTVVNDAVIRASTDTASLHLWVSDWSPAVVPTMTLTQTLVGIWTTTPTFSLTIQSSTSWLAVYNTAVDPTNFERWVFQRASNNLLIWFQAWWSGMWWRTVVLRATSSTWWSVADFSIARQNAPHYKFDMTTAIWSITSPAIALFTTSTSFGATANVSPIVSIAPTINQSSTAWYTILTINPTESATWSWTKLLQDWQVGSSSKAVVDNGGKFGFLTTAPTHTLTLASTSTWIALYNTADQTTNFERFRMYRSSNTMLITTWSWWTGVTRAMSFITYNSWSDGSGSWVRFDISRASSTAFNFTWANSPTQLSNGTQMSLSFSNTISSWISAWISIVGTIAQTWTAWYTVLDLNPTESTTWSWAKNFLLCRKASWSTIFGIDSTGIVTATGQITATWSITSTITGASSTVPVTITVDSSVATQTALLVQNATNYAHTGNLITGKLLNATDTGAVLKLENAWSWNYITADSVFSIAKSGKATFDATITPALTTGNQTINKPSGTVNIAAGWTTVTVTNSTCTTSSLVYVTVRTNDTTATIKNVVPWSGSFVITLTAAATAEVSIWFLVVN